MPIPHLTPTRNRLCLRVKSFTQLVAKFPIDDRQLSCRKFEASFTRLEGYLHFDCLLCDLKNYQKKLWRPSMSLFSSVHVTNLVLLVLSALLASGSGDSSSCTAGSFLSSTTEIPPLYVYGIKWDITGNIGGAKPLTCDSITIRPVRTP